MWIYSVIILVLESLCTVLGDQQSFIVAPSNVSVIEGRTVILKCQVANKKGTLQWTKDGFALGFDRSIPGYPRYEMSGSEGLGEYHLVIQSVQLADDAEYQCQVSPAAGDPALVGRAILSVMVQPKFPIIEGYTNGSVVRVSHDQPNLNLTCIARDGRPAATFKWFRNGEELTTGIVIVYSVQTTGTKLETGRSVLTITPRNDDNDALFTCQASNPALLRPTSVTVQLSVLHPPGVPVITGYSSEQVLKSGDTLNLVCVSRGGNPLAQVYWYLNGGGYEFSYTAGSNKAENDIIINVQPVHNNAIFQCQASNQMTLVPLTAEVKLSVQFPPANVTITGHQNAKAGDNITLRCESAISNPPAVVSWISRGRTIPSVSYPPVASPLGGFITTSEIHVVLSREENAVVYQCVATNEALGQTAHHYVTLEVMYPPQHPTISGTDGSPASAGGVQTLTCTAIGGNPPATLKWMKGTNNRTTELGGVRRETGNIISNQLSFLLKPDDNNADYSCYASNPATAVPLVATVRLSVLFPPKTLNITLNPTVVKVKQHLSITCKSSSSNPVSKLSWWKNGEEILGIDDGTVAAEYGGRSSISRLELTPSVLDHGEIYACRATNNPLAQAVSDAVTLNVLHPPYFPLGTPTTVDVIEKEDAILNVSAIGNPTNITYTWFFGERRLAIGVIPLRPFTEDGPMLNLTYIVRADAGNYYCEAENEEGRTVHTIALNVLFAAEIVSTSKDIMIDQGDNAILECRIRANPISVNVVTWSRVGYNMSRVTVQHTHEVSRLEISNAEKEDSGEFQCTANNGIGAPVSALARLLVKFAPIIDKSPTISKAAVDSGRDAILICRAEGIPVVSFAWHKGTADLSLNRSFYTVQAVKKVGLFHYESRLIIHNSTTADYGQYRCDARNALGQDTHFITLDGISIPDAPYILEFINATHNSITLTWKPGFDGGTPQWFQVAYNQVDSTGKKYEDVLPQGTNVYTIRGLKPGTEYEITVKGINRLGHGMFQEKVLKAWTALDPGLGTGDEIPLIIILAICIVGLLILALNVILILFFIRRRRKKLEKDGSDSASQPYTLEMGNAPMSNGSIVSYDRRSEDFPDELKAPFDVTDDLGRPYVPPGDPYYPGYYGPSVGLPPEYHRGIHPMVSGSREGLYPEPGVMNPLWDGGYRGPYTSASLPRDGDDYTEQLRKMQKNHLGQAGPRGSTLLPPGVPYAPSPPTRSSSKGAVDNLVGQGHPFRSYDSPADDIHRYSSPPDSMYPMSIGHGQRSSPHPLPELRGHLV